MTSKCNNMFVKTVSMCLGLFLFFMEIPCVTVAVQKLTFQQNDFDEDTAASLVTYFKYCADKLGITIDTQAKGICCSVKTLTPKESLQSVKWKDQNKNEQGLEVISNFFVLDGDKLKFDGNHIFFAGSALVDVGWNTVFSTGKESEPKSK